MSRLKDLTGQDFGYLSVLYKTHPNENGEMLWMCRCKCGNIVEVNGCRLRNGLTRSCGCYQKEQNRKSKHKHNIFYLRENYYVGVTNNTNKEFYFDIDDYEKIKDICWYENDQGYIMGLINGNHIRMHRYILNINDDKIVDHINQNRADNRKLNLRYATKQTNAINRKANVNNKTGIKGIDKISNGKYSARIMINYKTIYLGCFENINDAVKARKDAEKKYFGEFYNEENYE